VFPTLTGYLGAGSILLVALIAFSLGGRAEKIGTGAYVIAWIATVLVHGSNAGEGVQWGMLAIDTAVLLVFAGLVWKSGRAWPVWACALQLIVVASHIMIIAHLPTPISSFYTVVNLTSYGILIAICFGVFWAWQERKWAQISGLDEDSRIR
jgi:hypothetical protein